jgi:hypothetical protein
MPLNPLLIAGLTGFAGGLAYLLYCLCSRSSPQLPEPEWLQSFSANRYRPMLRMLSEDDPGFLRLQGLDKTAIRRIRRERRQIFRVYLGNLIRDFNLLHEAARLVLLMSEVDRPDLSARLIRTRVEFQRAVLAVRVRLFLHSLGLAGVDVRELVGALESVHVNFQAMTGDRFAASA